MHARIVCSYLLMLFRRAATLENDSVEALLRNLVWTDIFTELASGTAAAPAAVEVFNALPSPVYQVNSGCAAVLTTFSRRARSRVVVGEAGHAVVPEYSMRRSNSFLVVPVPTRAYTKVVLGQGFSAAVDRRTV